MIDFESTVQGLLPELVDFRHDLHRHPETAFNEERTAARIVDELEKLPSLEIRTGLAGGTGVVALLNDGKDGPCVLLRADMDALPIQEMSDLPYKSTIDGKMHACGHDGHSACLLGAAQVLSQHASALPGRVKFVFQPAEEDGAGGKRMIDDGVLDNPRVDAAFALHGWPDLAVGQVMSVGGPMLAAATPFEIDFHGKGGHAAYPHRARDVLVAAAQFMTSAQTIRSRFIDPLDPVVLSFCQLTGGFTHNVLPDRCHLKGTIRALSEKGQSAAKHLLEKFLHNVATAFEVHAEIRFLADYPMMFNDEACSAVAAEVAVEIVGDTNVITEFPSSMGGEDFAFYAQRVPATMFRIGLRPANAFEYPSLHNPCFDFNDDAIPIGVRMHCGVALRYLRRHAARPSEYII